MIVDKQTPRTIVGRVQRWFDELSFVWVALVVALVYLAVAVFMTWPLATQLSTRTPAGYGGDAWAHHWNYWWVKTAIAQGLNPYYTDLLYYPEGVSLTTHNIPWFNIGLWLPLQAFIGGPAAYGLIYILAFAFNGFAMFLLLREYTDRMAAAFVGGLIFGAWPYVVSQMGHPNMIVLGWVPLTLLMLKRTMERGRLRDAVAAGVFLALTGIVRWQLLIMASIAVGLFVTHKLATDSACRTRRTIMSLLLVGLVALALMAPLLLPVVADAIAQDDLDPVLKTGTERSSDLLSYVTPNRNLRLYSGLTRQLGDSLNFSGDQMKFIGFIALVLLLIGVIKGRPAAWLWMAMLVTYVILALGPELRIGHQSLPEVPMPYRLVQDFFLIRIVRNPARYNVFVGLPVAMLAGLGMTYLLNHPRLQRGTVLLTALFAILICAEYWFAPYRTLTLHTPDWYVELSQVPGEFAVLDLPMDRAGHDKLYMYFQTTHGRPLLQGHVSRVPPEAEEYLESNPFLKRLTSDNTMDPSLPVMHQLGQLSDAGVRYIILHKRQATAEQLEQWQEWLAFEPFHVDDELIVYETDPELLGDLPAGTLVTEALQLYQARLDPEEVTPTDPIYISSRWRSTRDMDRDYDLCFRLVDDAGQLAQQQCQRLGGEWPTSRWVVGEIAPGNMVMRIDPFVEAGTYQLNAALVETDTGTIVGDQIDIGPVTVNEKIRVYELPADIQSADALWENKISLPGYVLEQVDDRLELVVYWQALSRMESSYKYFVHLIDEATGALIAQEDVVPRQWSYPTNWWEQGEIVKDTISLPVGDVAPGNYLLYVGWYEPESGARLEVATSSGEPYPDNSVLLTAWQR